MEVFARACGREPGCGHLFLTGKVSRFPWIIRREGK
jgi:hypothetical protein